MGRWLLVAILFCMLCVPVLADDYIIIMKEQDNAIARGLTHMPEASMGQVKHAYRSIPAVAARLSPEEFNMLQDDPRVAAIIPDTQRKLLLTDTLAIIKATEAHLTQLDSTNLTGIGQSICIIDTGIDYSHPAFAGKILESYNFITNTANASDDNGHGTHVAGIAVGNGSVMGVAPGAGLVIAKVCDSEGTCFDSDILAGIEFCNNRSSTWNISVISASLGGGGPYTAANCSLDAGYALLEPALEEAASLGILPVFASGNDHYTTGISYPACSPQVISVGSTTKADTISAFSNRGDRLDIYAPGQSIISAAPGGGTATASGTSMATPHIAGMLAILQQHELAYNRSLNRSAAVEVLQDTGTPVGTTARADLGNAVRWLRTGYLMNRSTGGLLNATATTEVVLNTTIDNTSCIILRQNLIGIDTGACPQYNTSAQLRIAGLQLAAVPLRNGEPCPEDICTGVNYSLGTLTFNVSGFSNYSALEQELLNLSITAPAAAVKGRAFNLTINMTNAGGEAALETILALTMNGSITAAPYNYTNTTLTIGSIAPNSTLLFNVTMHMSTDLQNGTNETIFANVSYESSTGAGFSAADNSTMLILGAPNLSMSIADTPDPAISEINYTISVNNSGDETAYDAVLLLTYAAGITILNTSMESADNRTFLLGNLTPNQTREINITTNFTSSTALTTTAQLNFTYAGENSTLDESETTSLPPPPTSSGSGGGGGNGGGGGGGVPSRTFAWEGTAVTLYRNDKLVFKADDVQYTLHMTGLSQKDAELALSGANLTTNIILSPQENASFDLQNSTVILSLTIAYPRATLAVTIMPASTAPLAPVAAANETGEPESAEQDGETNTTPLQVPQPLHVTEPKATDPTTAPEQAQTQWYWLTAIAALTLAVILSIRARALS